MTDTINPSKICQDVKDKLKTRSEALKLLETVISESENETYRIDAIKSIGELSITSDKAYKILEKCLVTDESPLVRVESAKILLLHFEEQDLSPILWRIENEDSIIFIKILLDFFESNKTPAIKVIYKSLIEKLKKVYYLAYPDMKLIIDLDFLESLKFLKRFNIFSNKFAVKSEYQRELIAQNTIVSDKGLSRINKISNQHIISLEIHEIDEIPISINHLPKLEILKIDHCNFEDKNLDHLNLTHLNDLKFSNNQLDEIPIWVWKIANKKNYIRKFLKNGVNVSQASILALLEILTSSNLKKIKKQEILQLKKTNFYKIDEFGRIIGLYISNLNNRMGIFPKQLCNLKYLEELHLVDQKIKEIPKCWINLKRLRILNLSNNPISIIPEFIEINHTLEYLDLHLDADYGTNLINLPETIENLKRLKKLDLRGRDTKNIPESLKKANYTKYDD